MFRHLKTVYKCKQMNKYFRVVGVFRAIHSCFECFYEIHSFSVYMNIFETRVIFFRINRNIFAGGTKTS